MIFKLKSKFYKLTGIYLAHKEENRYAHSNEFWRSFNEMANRSSDDEWGDLDPRAIHGILIGLWQVKHGFTRPYKRDVNRLKRFKKRIKLGAKRDF